MDVHGYTTKRKGGFQIGNTAACSPDKIKIERIADTHTDISPSASSAPSDTLNCSETMPNKSKKKKSQRNRRQREVAEGLEAFEEQPPTSIGLTSTGVWIFSLPFALFFFLSNTPLSLHCSIRCPLAPACSICAPRQFTFFVFNSFRTERDHRCVYFLRRFFVFFQSNTLLFSTFRAHYFVLYSYPSVLPSCRAAAVP